MISPSTIFNLLIYNNINTPTKKDFYFKKVYKLCVILSNFSKIIYKFY